MGLETDTDVKTLRDVRDENGEEQPPANAAEQQRLADAAENEPDGFEAKVQPATTDETLPSHSVADGCEVLVYADPANSGVIYLGFGTATVPITKGNGLTFAVDNTNALVAKADTSGDVLHIIGEGGA